MIKYSLLMPYYNRHIETRLALQSYVDIYKRSDFEIIFIEDIKNIQNKEYHDNLINLVAEFKDKLNIKVIPSNFENCYNPAPLFNLGVENASGDYLIITNPETTHSVDILSGLDKEFEENEYIYVLCGCANVDTETRQIVSWYQHSKHRNAMLHFCSAISKENYRKIDGFDDNYKYGYCFDDDDFRNAVMKNKLKIILRDDLLAHHLNHEKVSNGLTNVDELWNINKNYYGQKWYGQELKTEILIR